jgi:hypothetical protein
MKIAITQAAVDTIVATFDAPVVPANQRLTDGRTWGWLETRWVRKLSAIRGEGESYSDVIIRLVEAELRGLGALTRGVVGAARSDWGLRTTLRHDPLKA